MKAKLFQLNSLLSKINNPYCVVLFYGTDDGEINKGFQQVKSFLHTDSNQFDTVELSADLLKKNSFIATEEANTISLMGGHRIILIQEETSFNDKSLIHFLDNKKTDAILVIKAGNLIKTSLLRKEAEQNPYVLAIPCYTPTELELQQNISDNKAGKTFSPETLKYLTQKLSTNSGVIQQELNKILTFLGSEKRLTLAIIDEIVTDSADISLDQFCISVASGHIQKVDRELQILSSTNENISSALYALTNYFTILNQLIESGSLFANKEKILMKELKSNQFKLKEPLIMQSQYWSKTAALTVLHELHKLELFSRQTGIPEQTIFVRTCIKITELASKLNRLS